MVQYWDRQAKGFHPGVVHGPRVDPTRRGSASQPCRPGAAACYGYSSAKRERAGRFLIEIKTDTVTNPGSYEPASTVSGGDTAFLYGSTIAACVQSQRCWENISDRLMATYPHAHAWSLAAVPVSHDKAHSNER